MINILSILCLTVQVYPVHVYITDFEAMHSSCFEYSLEVVSFTLCDIYNSQRKTHLFGQSPYTHLLFMVCICEQNIQNLAFEDSNIQIGQNPIFCYDGNILYLCCPAWAHVTLNHLKLGVSVDLATFYLACFCSLLNLSFSNTQWGPQFLLQGVIHTQKLKQSRKRIRHIYYQSDMLVKESRKKEMVKIDCSLGAPCWLSWQNTCVTLDFWVVSSSTCWVYSLLFKKVDCSLIMNDV